METIRSAFTVLSVLTFFGIVLWAVGKQGRRVAAAANADLLADDDRVIAGGEAHKGERN